MEHDEAMLTIAYFISEVPIHHAPRLRKYARMEFVHPTHRAERLLEGQIKPTCGCGRCLHQAIQLYLIYFAEVDRKESYADERLCKLFGGDGRAVDICLWFTHAKEDNWCAPEPGGLKNWQIDDGNRAFRLGRPLSKVRFRASEAFCPEMQPTESMLR